MADVATDVRSFNLCLEPKAPREQNVILDEEFQPVYIFFLWGKTREFRVSSLCLHVFPAAALTSCNALRRLTNSSLGSKWKGGKKPSRSIQGSGMSLQTRRDRERL